MGIKAPSRDFFCWTMLNAAFASQDFPGDLAAANPDIPFSFPVTGVFD
jgi:hypothetical protein